MPQSVATGAETVTAAIEPFNPFAPEIFVNPYPILRQYRALAPVHYGKPDIPDLPGCWYVFRHEDVQAVLKNNKSIAKEIQRIIPPEKLPPTPDSIKPFITMLDQWMLRRDQPDHTRLRALVNKAFTPRMVENLRPRIEEIADGLLVRMTGIEQLDLISNFAVLLPVMVIAELLGVPMSDYERFRNWSNKIAAGFSARPSNDVAIASNAATLEITEYLRHLVNARRRDPQDDLISNLIAAEEEGGKLNEDELIANCVLLLFAGHETTVNLIGNGTLALLRNRDQLDLLQQNLGLVGNAVEEFLRYDSPVQMVPRFIFEDMEIGGKQLHKGDRIVTMVGAANHDPEIFDDPDKLDITRKISSKHSAFGLGIHFCLGAPLARLEGEIAFSKLLSRFPNIKLAIDPANIEWQKIPVFRGLKHLPVFL